MNNEPVAIVKLGGDVEWLTDVLPYNAKLYTHPAKTITEIIEKNKPEIEKANAYIKSLEDEIAILRKAQEK
jgi:hypothetical protein